MLDLCSTCDFWLLVFVVTAESSGLVMVLLACTQSTADPFDMRLVSCAGPCAKLMTSGHVSVRVTAQRVCEPPEGPGNESLGHY